MSALAPSRREIRLDLLRGYFFVGMTLEHLPSHPLSPLFRQTYGFVSVAEGFVFVSGIVFALVYGKTFLREGRRSLRRRACSRARDIYLNHAGLYTLLVLAGAYSGHQFREHLFAMWWRGVLMLYQPGLFFLLPMYFVFVLSGALLLELMLRGHEELVLAGSFVLWLAAQFGVGLPPLAPSWYHPGPFNVLAWQFLFYAGMYFGCRRLRSKQVAPRSWLLLIVSATLTAGFFVARHWPALLAFVTDAWHETAMTTWKYNCHPVRMINFVCIAYVMLYVSGWIGERSLRNMVCRMLAFIGRHSLPVYGWSLTVTYAAIRLEYRWAMLTHGAQTALAILTTLSLLLPA
jgi:hypothetical protein